MELLVFAILVIVLAAYGIARVRSGGSVDDPDRVRQGLPDDRRDKFTQGWGLRGPHPTVPSARPLTRESGSGKDGGG